MNPSWDLCNRAIRRAKLGRIRPALGISPTLDLACLAPDLVARITVAMPDGTFPQSFGDDDLEALVVLADQQEAI